jgi:hypothetical protein
MPFFPLTLLSQVRYACGIHRKTGGISMEHSEAKASTTIPAQGKQKRWLVIINWMFVCFVLVALLTALFLNNRGNLFHYELAIAIFFAGISNLLTGSIRIRSERRQRKRVRWYGNAQILVGLFLFVDGLTLFFLG